MKTVALMLLLLAVRAHAQAISIDPANPHYYLFHGKPIVLVTSAEHYGAVINGDTNLLH
jgi:hypothetical protein